MNPDLLHSLIPIAAPLIIAGLKFLIPQLPKPLLPVLAPVIGAAIEILAHFAGSPEFSPITGAVLGAAGVALREAYDQTKKAISPTLGPKR